MRDDGAAAERRRLACSVTVGYRVGGRHLALAVRTGPGQFFPLRTHPTPIAVRLVSKRNQLWHRRHSRPNKLRLFMVSEPTQAKPTTQTISSRSVQLASLDRPDAKLEELIF